MRRTGTFLARTTRARRGRLALVVLAWLLAPGCGDSGEEAKASGEESAAAEKAPPPFETPPVLQAADVVRDDLRSGPDFSLADAVHNDGFMNRYRIRSTWGEIDVVSTPLLRKRVREIYAIRQIEELSKTKEFAKGVGEAGKGAARGAVHLVTDPVDTVSSAASGVGKLFGMAKKSVSGDKDKASDTEDSTWKQAAGYAQTKRNYAKELKIDVYTRNPLLEKRLDDLAWAGWAGGITGGLAMVAIPGGIGVAVSVSKNTDLLNRIDVTRPPSEIRKDNGGKLRAMGIPADSVDRFLDDSTLSPTEQTLIVVALEDMETTEGRGHFLDFATGAPDADVASFAVLQATLFSRYHASQAPIARFQPIGQRLVARTEDGSAVGIHPTDHLFWTESAAAIADSADPQLTDAPHKFLWVGGRASDAARQGLASKGWEVREGALDALSGG